MKKSILFVMNKLVCGGAEKSLLSVLESIDYSKYNVDLFLFRHEGMFLNRIPKEVTLLPEPVNYKYLDMPIKNSLSELIKRRDYKLALNRSILGYLAKTEDNGALVEQRFWRYLSNSIGEIKKEYDVAIGFLEKNPIYFCVDKVKAKIKIGWIHTDYSKLGINSSIEQYYFNKLNYIATVSDELVDILSNEFPSIRNKFKCIYNIVSSKVIKKLSLEKVDLRVKDDKSIAIISVGRLAKEKGLDISLEAFDILIRRGYDIKWFLIGDGNVRGELEEKIREKKLQDRVNLLGVKDNPYPYIRMADIYLQTSRYEGKSIAIDEAKILAKPILITNFETANSHITDHENGIISDMNPLSVAEGLEKLIIDKHLRHKFSENLMTKDFGTENEINRLYQLMESVGI